MMEKQMSCRYCGGEVGYIRPEPVRGAPLVTVGVRCRKCRAYLHLTQVPSGMDHEEIQAVVWHTYRAIVERRRGGQWV